MPVLHDQFGSIDIYLFDQLLKGRIAKGMRVLEAGCGSGRNLVYLLRSGFEVYGADENKESITAVRRLAAALAPGLPPENFRAEPVEAMSFEDESADVVLSIAVLHFARDVRHFEAMLDGTWSVLRPGGLFFCRLATSIGIKDQVRQLAAGRYLLPDGSERYLVDQGYLMHASQRLGGQWIEPLKTTVVQDQRSMTTWVLRKS